MRVTGVFSEGPYTITSYGNGWAYAVEHAAAGLSFWLQDEGASQFRDEMESAAEPHTATHICADYMAAIGRAAE